MKLHYYPQTDSLYIELKAGSSAETREIANGLNIDFDEQGDVVGIDVEADGFHVCLSLRPPLTRAR